MMLTDLWAEVSKILSFFLQFGESSAVSTIIIYRYKSPNYQSFKKS